MINKLKTTQVSADQLSKIQRDLKFIDLLTKVAKKKNMRVIVHGGYAVDGFFETITRPHGDIDLGIWGNEKNAVRAVTELLNSVGSEDDYFSNMEIEDEGRNDWTHTLNATKSNFRVEMYYGQVANDPFSHEKHVVKKNGEVVQQTHETQIVHLLGVSFEAWTPLQSLVDRVFKQQRGDGVHAHHVQDIENLRLVIDDT